MTVPLSNSGGQPSPGMMQDRPDMGFGPEAGLARDGRKRGQSDAGDMAVAAAFAMQLAGARAVLATPDDESENVVVAVPIPPPVIFGLADAEVDPATRRADIAALADRLISEVAASDRVRLGGGGPVTLNLSLNAPSLGLTEARLVLAQGELTVVFPTRAGADPAVINGALAELAQALAQRFPNRTIRLRGEEQGRDAGDPAEFNPFKEPVGRRK
jgi:hypothetical protein